jgi:hypothetical protein
MSDNMRARDFRTLAHEARLAGWQIHPLRGGHMIWRYHELYRTIWYLTKGASMPTAQAKPDAAPFAHRAQQRRLEGALRSLQATAIRHPSIRRPSDIRQA